MLIVTILTTKIGHNPQKATLFSMFNFFLHTSLLQYDKYALTLYKAFNHLIIKREKYEEKYFDGISTCCSPCFPVTAFR